MSQGNLKMVQTPAQTLTVEDFLNLPETEPASEYIDGRIIQKPMPQGKHSAIQTELPPAINLVVKPKQIARAFTELRCTYGGRSTIPDISVFTWNRIPRKENGGIANAFLIAPDWTIEILSPDQSQTKVTKNILHCLKQGCFILKEWIESHLETTCAVGLLGIYFQAFEWCSFRMKQPCA